MTTVTYVPGAIRNRLTGETMVRPVYPRFTDYPHVTEWTTAYYRYLSQMKVWNAFLEALPTEYAWERPKLKHATKKGVPVPRTASHGRRKYKNGAGVSANSRVLPHRYADEGDKGQQHRREIRRKERTLWESEAYAELSCADDAYSVSEWYFGHDMGTL